MDTTPKAANTVHGTNFSGHGTNWDTKLHRPLHWGYRLRGGNRRRYPDVLTAQTTGVNHLSMSKLPNTPEGVSSEAGSFCSTLLARQLLILRPTSELGFARGGNRRLTEATTLLLWLVCMAHYFSLVVMTRCELCKAPKSPEDHRVSRKRVEARVQCSGRRDAFARRQGSDRAL